METEHHDEGTHEAKYQEVKLTPNLKNYDPKDEFRVKHVAGGWGHTAVITGIFFYIFYKVLFVVFSLEKGEIFTWGFNVKGQLGVGDKESRLIPQMLLRDIMDKDLPPFKSVACGYFNTFAVDGIFYSISNNFKFF